MERQSMKIEEDLQKKKKKKKLSSDKLLVFVVAQLSWKGCRLNV